MMIARYLLTVDSFRDEKHKFRIILQRMKVLKDALCNPDTVRGYVNPPIDITLIFPSLRSIIENGRLIMSRMMTNATGQLLKVPCGCGDASHTCDLRALSKDSGNLHWREPSAALHGSQSAHVGPVMPMSVGRAYATYSDDDMSDNDDPRDPRGLMYRYTQSVAER